MRLANIDIRHLRHALALADLRSFSLAAQRVHLTQSAFSRSIQSLETELGIALFERGRSGAMPTTMGQDFLRQARALEADWSRLEDFGRDLAEGERGEVHVGLGSSVASMILPDLLIESVGRWPRLMLSVQVMPIPMLIEELRQERCDFAIMADIRLVEDKLIMSEPVATARPSLVVRAGHPLAKAAAIPRDALADYPLLVGALTTASVREWYGREQKVVLCDDATSLRRTALQTEAIWSTLAEAVGDDLSAGRLVELDLAMDTGPAAVNLFLRRGRTASAAVERIRGLARDLLTAKLARA